MPEIFPGYYVSQEEYYRRFKDVDLEYFRARMPPKLFEAFVRNMGIIEGYGLLPESSLEDFLAGE